MVKIILFVVISSFFSLHASEVNDPFEKFNRKTFEFNENLDELVVKPVAEVYSEFPVFIKTGVTNFFNNLENIETSVNQMLQGKPGKSLNDLTRFIINTSIGVAGIFDVASSMGLERNEEDFGQTLAVWGFDEGPYIMLPFLGPSTLRDTISRPISSFTSVIFHMTDTDVNIALKSIDALETRERLLDVESLLSGDKYIFVKDAYMQSMNYEISDGIDVDDTFVDDMEDFLID